jgi:hypothetical protein
MKLPECSLIYYPAASGSKTRLRAELRNGEIALKVAYLNFQKTSLNLKQAYLRLQWPSSGLKEVL